MIATITPQTPFPIPSMRRIQRLHFVGIGGSGMNGIAEVCKNLGYEVTGSDQQYSSVIERLEQLGVSVAIGHVAEQVEGADVVIVSTAIDAHNPEYQAAQALGIPIVPRAMMLAELMRFRHGIAVAGTHGKTTTTSIIVAIFEQAGYDPTYVIGGILNQAGRSAQLGKSRFFVVEADESDASFHHLQPMVSVVTNIDLDHMDTYGGDPAELEQNFATFVQRLPFYGLVVCCIDDERVRRCLPQFRRPALTYGFSKEAQYRCVSWQQTGLQSEILLEREGHGDLRFTLNLPGQHNVLNAIAAIAVATEEGIEDHAIVAALQQFQGVNRRFTTYLNKCLHDQPLTLVDDYGHHPQEVAAVIAAARLAWPKRRLLLVFQPHRYSRTRDLYEDFVQVLSAVDGLIMLKEYAAGEQPIVKADSKALCASLRRRGLEPCYAQDFNELKTCLQQRLQNDDIVIFQGAGDVGRFAQQVIQMLTPIKRTDSHAASS